MENISGLIGGRMDRSYQEQVWTVGIVVGLNAAILVPRADVALVLFGATTAAWAVAITGALATIFVWSRHGIYLYYDHLIRSRATNDAVAAASQSRPLRVARLLALWSGVLFYSFITVGLTVASVVVLRH
jgi:hypothetical protein